MKTLAYIYGKVTAVQLQMLEKHDITTIFVDIPEEQNNGEQTEESLNHILKLLDPGDRIIINNLASLNRTLTELSIFLKSIKEKNIELIILNKEEEFGVLTDNQLLSLIMDTHEQNQSVLQEKTKKAFKTAKSVGRPKISEELIARMRYLRLTKKYSLRDTAELCNVSVGTVYKYADNQ